MKRLKDFYFRTWRQAVAVLLLTAVGYLVFFHNLGDLLPGYAPSEVASYHASEHFKGIVAHPVDAPYKVLVYGIIHFAPNHLFATRVVAAGIGVLACLLFFVVVHAWFSYRIAFLTTILFATSNGLLHIARLGSPLVLQLALLLLIAGALWLQNTAHRTIALYGTIAVLVAAIYIPGLVWFELLGLVLWRKAVMNELRKLSWPHVTLVSLLGVLFLAPLIRACIIFPSTIRDIFGLPDHLSSITNFGTNLLHTVSSIGFRSYGTSDILLGHTPLLDITQVVLLLLGGAVFFRHWRLARSGFLFAATGLAVVLASLGGSVTTSVLLPLLYIFIAAGLYELLRIWLSVFPKNPFARLTGLFIVICLVLFSVLYQWRAYFIAWPYNAATRTTFSHHEL
ncbi:MAG: hypothetical protein WC498_01940 [Candidatus Saccharimonadales bacterium]